MISFGKLRAEMRALDELLPENGSVILKLHDVDPTDNPHGGLLGGDGMPKPAQLGAPARLLPQWTVPLAADGSKASEVWVSMWNGDTPVMTVGCWHAESGSRLVVVDLPWPKVVIG